MNHKLNIPSAAQAIGAQETKNREEENKRLEELEYKEFRRIEAEINKAILEEKTEIKGDGWLQESTQLALKELGYKYFESDRAYQFFWSVSWGN